MKITLPRTKKTAIITAAGLILITGATGTGIYLATKEDAKQPIATESSDIYDEVTPTQISEYTSRDKYKGKTVRVTGLILPSEKGHFVIRDIGESPSRVAIEAYADDPLFLTRYITNQPVTVTGRLVSKEEAKGKLTEGTLTGFYVTSAENK